MKKKTVIVGMSGGVDSSVSALLLKKEGYDVIGVFMKNWEETSPNGVCSSSIDYSDVVQVCQKIDIPCYSYNFAKEYKEEVFSHFLEEYKQGYTPNPDILCNREIKFKVFLEKAKELGADYLATGHYAQNILFENIPSLFKGKDPGKDQSYFLYTLKSKVLQSVLFPIGHLLKSQVREIAKEHQLPTAEKKDSTGICFIGKRDFRPFLGEYLGFSPGEFQTLDGHVVGTHQGAFFYTIGQRKGLQIGGKGEAWFVVDKDMSQNVVFVEQGENHPALFSDDLTASDITWVDERAPKLPCLCHAKVRYRQTDQPCIIQKIENGILHVDFLTPQRAITPRQSVVFYDGERCLGGGMIIKRGLSYQEKDKKVL